MPAEGAWGGKGNQSFRKGEFSQGHQVMEGEHRGRKAPWGRQRRAFAGRMGRVWILSRGSGRERSMAPQAEGTAQEKTLPCGGVGI